MKNTLLLVALCFAILLQTYSQEIYVSIQCSNSNPGSGEQIKLVYTLKMKMQNGSASISHNGIKVQKPSFKGINVLDEGSEPTDFSFGSFGDDFQISKYSFILQPITKGKVTIEPLTFLMNGKKYTSKPFVLNVGDGNPNAKLEDKKSNLYLKIVPSKSEVYIGEPFIVSYILYSRLGDLYLEGYNFPNNTDFSIDEIQPKGNKNWPQTIQIIEGVEYAIIPIKKDYYVAKSTGEFELQQASLDIMVGGSMFTQGQKYPLKSNKPIIKVKPLPKDEPKEFYNQIGSNYKLSVSYSKTTLKANEPIDLTIKISGEGTISKLNPLKLNIPKEFDIYEPEIMDSTQIKSINLSGSKTFNYLLIPRYKGEFEIPEISFTYLDVVTNKYVTLKYPSQKITVTEGDNIPITASKNLQDSIISPTDISPIYFESDLKKTGEHYFKSTLFWSLTTIPLALSLVLFFFLGFVSKKKEDIVHKPKDLSKKALKVIEQAQQKLTQNDDKGFYENLHKGLLEYLSFSLKIEFSQLSTETIQAALEAKKADSKTIETLISILDECTMARFSPTTLQGAKETLDTSIAIIKTIESYVKK
jgi:hypothetical protein